MQEQKTKWLKLLIVEDEEVISEICRRTLEHDYEITLALHGQAAVDVLNEKAFDIALIDIRTPLMNGQELCLWITEHRPHMIPIIIFTTGDVISNSTEDFLTNKNQPYLPKPFSPKELTEIIEKVVSTL